MSSGLAQRIAAARQAINAGKLPLAAQIARDLLAQSPDQIDALEIKALAELEQGQDAAAEQTLRRAIAVAPERRWPYADLTRLLMRLGRADDAEQVVRAALAADPDNADAHAILASLLGEREMLVGAEAHFERAIAFAGRHPQLLLGLGRARMRQGKLDDALPLLEQAAAAMPNALEAAVYLAELHERLGQFGQAMQQLDRADAMARPTGTDVMLQRVTLLDRMGRTAEALALLESADRLSGAALLQRGRLRQKLGRHADAWSDWSEAKAMLARQYSRAYPAEAVQWEADGLAEFFHSSGIASLPRAETRTDVPQPIFILGFPRSGTTLVEQILASHSGIRAGGELPFARQMKEFAVTLAGGADAFPDALAKQTRWPALLRDFYLAKAAEAGLAAAGPRYFTDKMPLNEMWLPLIRAAFPRSPTIRVRRHPLDVLTSVVAHDMTHGFNCAYRPEDAARHLALIDDLVERYAAAGLRPTHELRYESLVADQRGETERLMRALGLDIEESQLRFHERTFVSPTPSYAQVREPMNDRAVGKWRNYAAQLAPVIPIVARAIERGGYTA